MCHQKSRPLVRGVRGSVGGGALDSVCHQWCGCRIKHSGGESNAFSGADDDHTGLTSFLAGGG